MIVHLLDECAGGPPVYVDPVSTAYARVLAPHIGRFDTAKPNKMELEILSGMEISSHEDLLRACEIVLGKGLKRVFVSQGKGGCLYMDQTGRVLERKLRPLLYIIPLWAPRHLLQTGFAEQLQLLKIHLVVEPNRRLSLGLKRMQKSV